jgi:hypothetical protein
MAQSQNFELKSQGLDQREMSQILHVSPATITFDLQYLCKEARKTIREYPTEQLPLQLRIFMVANQNAIKQYWDISQKAQDNNEKIQALEHYLDSHHQLWTLLYGGEDHMVRFGKSCHNNSINIKRMNLLLQKVNLSPPITE